VRVFFFLQGAPSADIVRLLDLARDMDRDTMGQPETTKIVVPEWVQELGTSSEQPKICLSVLVQERCRVEATVPHMQP
jgi:hypothetical protein